MPKFDELPMLAQTKSGRPGGSRRGASAKDPDVAVARRLANVGLGRRDEETEPPIAARTSGPAMAPLPPLPERKPQRSVAQQIAAQEPVSEYAPPPAAPGIGHPRPPGACIAAAPQGDDHLDIPAFLRRQVN